MEQFATDNSTLAFTLGKIEKSVRKNVSVDTHGEKALFGTMPSFQN